jgi:hypothetical protein
VDLAQEVEALLEPVVPNQARRALPICVQKPWMALWRAPVSSMSLAIPILIPMFQWESPP